MHYNPSSSSYNNNTQPAITSTYNRRINSAYRQRTRRTVDLDRDLYAQHSLLGQDAYWSDANAESSQFNTPMELEYQSPLSVATTNNAFDDVNALGFATTGGDDVDVASAGKSTTPAVTSPNPFLDDATAAAARWPSTTTSTPTLPGARPMRTSPNLQNNRLSWSHRHHESDSSSSIGNLDGRPLDDDQYSRPTITSSTQQRRPPPLPRTTRRSRMTPSNSITYDLPPRSLDAAPQSTTTTPVIINKRLTTNPLTPTSPPASSASSSSASSAALSSPSSVDTTSSSTATPTSSAVRRRPSPFPLGPVPAPVPSRRRNRYEPPAPHIVDIAVETFNLPTTTLSTTHRRSIDSEASRMSPIHRASTLIDDEEEENTPAASTNNVRSSPVRLHMQQGHLDKSAIHSSLEEERERHWRRLDEERARSMEITWDVNAMANEKQEGACKKWSKKEKPVKEKKEKSEKKEKKSWWRSCFGGGRAIVHDEEVVPPTPMPVVEDDHDMFAETFRDEEEEEEEDELAREEEVQDEKRAMRGKRRKTLKKRL